jgi:hypothetical protein
LIISFPFFMALGGVHQFHTPYVSDLSHRLLAFLWSLKGECVVVCHMV